MNGILLRKKTTGLYLLNDLGWTRDPESAIHFANEGEADQFARNHRIRDYEVGINKQKPPNTPAGGVAAKFIIPD